MVSVSFNQEMRKVQSEFRLASAELGKHGSELDKLETKSDSLTKQGNPAAREWGSRSCP